MTKFPDRDEDNGLWSAALRRGDYKLIWGQSKLLKQKVDYCMIIDFLILLNLQLIDIMLDAKRCGEKGTLQRD